MPEIRPQTAITVFPSYEEARCNADNEAAKGNERVVLHLDEGQTDEAGVTGHYVSVSLAEWYWYYPWVSDERVEYYAQSQ